MYLDRSSIICHPEGMVKKAERRDTNTLAFDIMQQVTGQKPEPVKNKAAVALGRLGGLKGGKARAATAHSLYARVPTDSQRNLRLARTPILIS